MRSVSRRFLTDSEVRVILTTTSVLDQHPEFKESFLCFDTRANDGDIAIDLHKVFDHHCDAYFAEGVEMHARMRDLLNEKGLKDQLLSKLTRPVDIYNFFQRLATDEPEDGSEALSWAASLVGNYDRRAQTRNWFDPLEDNEKLYVMLVVLFKGLPHAQMNEVYDEMVKMLRVELREMFDDPRSMNVEQMLTKLRLQERSEALAFIGQDPQAYEKEIGYQIKNYYRLLWTLVEPLIETLKAAKEQRTRRLLATAIAQIGIYRKTGLHEELTKLAHQSDARIVLSTADILRYLARDVHPSRFYFECTEKLG